MDLDLIDLTPFEPLLAQNGPPSSQSQPDPIRSQSIFDNDIFAIVVNAESFSSTGQAGMEQSIHSIDHSSDTSSVTDQVTNHRQTPVNFQPAASTTATKFKGLTIFPSIMKRSCAIINKNATATFGDILGV